MCSSNVHYYIICLTVGSLHKKQDVHEDDENKDPIDEYDCDLSSQVPHKELYHEDLSQDFDWKCCDYKDNSGNNQVLHRELLHGGINNDAVHNETETCNFTSNVEGDLNVHEETTHEEIHSNDHLRWTQNDYYYFYGFMQIVTRILTLLGSLLKSLIMRNISVSSIRSFAKKSSMIVRKISVIKPRKLAEMFAPMKLNQQVLLQSTH